MCYHAEFGRSRSNCVCISSPLGPRRLEIEGLAVVDRLKQAPPHAYYHAEFGRSALKDVGINTGKPKKLRSPGLRSLGTAGVADPKIHAPPRMLPR